MVLSRRRALIIVCSFFIYFITLILPCLAQEQTIRKDQYLITEEQTLQIVVHIWGEVNNPGQYIVPDGTDVLELISLAGGPTEYSNLGNVKLTREYFDSETEDSGNEKLKGQRNGEPIKKKVIYSINIDKHLDKRELEVVHVLQPGDIVKVNKNNWFRFQNIIKVVYQVAIIAQGLYYFGRLLE